MDKKWKDMTTREKVLSTVEMVFMIVAAVFAVADIANWMDNVQPVWSLAIAVASLAEAARRWKENRKLAVISLICGICLTVVGIMYFFI